MAEEGSGDGTRAMGRGVVASDGDGVGVCCLESTAWDHALDDGAEGAAEADFPTALHDGWSVDDVEGASLSVQVNHVVPHCVWQSVCSGTLGLMVAFSYIKTRENEKERERDGVGEDL